MFVRNIACILIIVRLCLAQNVQFFNTNHSFFSYSPPSAEKGSGKVIIPYQDDIQVYLDGKSIDRYPNAKLTKRIIASNKSWVVDKLPLKQYEIRIDQTYHAPLVEKFTLSQSRPTKEIDFIDRMQLLTAKIELSSNADGKGRMSGKKSGTFKLKQDDKTFVTVPYGKYTLTAQPPGYFPVQQNVSIFVQDPSPISIEFKPYNKKGAVKRSLLIPGLGQFYSRQKTKGLFFGMISGLGVGLLVNSVMEYDSELQKYNTLADEYLAATTAESLTEYGSELDTSKKRLTDLQTYFLAGASTVLLTYTWNIFDIAVLFPYD